MKNNLLLAVFFTAISHFMWEITNKYIKKKDLSNSET